MAAGSMEDQTPPSAQFHEDEATASRREEHIPNTTQIVASEPAKELEDTSLIDARKEMQEEASKFISQQFPAMKASLKERLSISVYLRRRRLLEWKQQGEEARAAGKYVRTMTEAESKKRLSDRSSYLSIEDKRWRSETYFPKEPEIEWPQLHGVCLICFVSLPKEEAEGGSWM